MATVSYKPVASIHLIQPLISGDAQAFTASWVNLGGVINAKSASAIGLFLKLDVNNTTDMRIRAVGKLTESATDLYYIPIKTVGASKVNVEAEYIEFTNDIDQNAILEIITDGLIPYIQFQIECSVVGVSAGTVAEANISFKE
jgi:hypothetical protein